MLDRLKKLVPALVAGLLAGAGCGHSHSGPPPNDPSVGLGSPRPGTVMGNWVVDGNSVQVIRDTGQKYAIFGDEAYRLGSSLVEVVLGTYVGRNSVLEQEVRAFNSSYEVYANRVNPQGFHFHLILDYSWPQNLPPRSDYLEIDTSGQLQNGRLAVYYLLRVVQPPFPNDPPVEIDRDEVRFFCDPGPATERDMSGTWKVKTVDVIEDEGPPHDIRVDDEFVAGSGRVLSVLTTPWTDAGLRDALQLPPEVITYVGYSYADYGFMQGIAMFQGDSRSKYADLLIVVLFDFVRTGDLLQGEWLYIEEDTNFYNVDDLWLTLDRPAALQASYSDPESVPLLDWRDNKIARFVRRYR